MPYCVSAHWTACRKRLRLCTEQKYGCFLERKANFLPSNDYHIVVAVIGWLKSRSLYKCMPLSSSSKTSHCSYSPSCAWDQFSLYSQFLLLYKKSFRGNHSVSWDVNEVSFYLFLRWIHSLYDLHRWRHQFPNEVKILLTIRSNPANIAQPRRLIKTRLHYAGKTSFFSVSNRAEGKPKVGKLCTTLVFRIVY